MRTMRYTLNQRIDADLNISASYELIVSADPVENREAGEEFFNTFASFVAGFTEAGKRWQEEQA